MHFRYPLLPALARAILTCAIHGGGVERESNQSCSTEGDGTDTLSLHGIGGFNGYGWQAQAQE